MRRVAHLVVSVMSRRPIRWIAPTARLRSAAMTRGPEPVRAVEWSSRVDRVAEPVWLPRSRRTPSAVSALYISHTSWHVCPNHLCSLALWTAFPPSLAGRDPFDYYEHSVALGLASLRRSRVRPCRTS